MTSTAKQQQGLTLITIIFILAILGFFVLLGLKIGPIYMNHSKVVNALSAVENMVDVETMSKHEIMSSLNKRFGMNYVDKVTDEDITITKHDDYLKVAIVYERVEKIMGNLSVLVEFDESFEAGDK
ncbi:MAG: DUF4845 domain-containing protein [Methylococcales bacterium]|nr:DUF4845 domain-containing protein [Methylococcales bacterium]